jgi:hypothetical protein
MPIRTANGPTARIKTPGHLLAHRQGHVSHRHGVIWTRVGQAPDHHVGVTDRLDLLQPSLLGELVEHREQAVQDPHHLLGGDLLAVVG